MPPTYTTKQAATRLQVSPNTLRNWSGQYSEFLSESARPGFQPERLFTDHDLTVLTYVARLRSEGLTVQAITERLGETTFGASEVLIVEAPNTLQTAPLEPPDAPECHDLTVAPTVPPDYLVAIERRFEAIEAAAQEAKRDRQNTTLVFLLGLTAGIVLVVGLLALAALWWR